MGVDQPGRAGVVEIRQGAPVQFGGEFRFGKQPVGIAGNDFDGRPAPCSPRRNSRTSTHPPSREFSGSSQGGSLIGSGKAAINGDHIKIEISDAVKVATGCVREDGAGRAAGGADKARGKRYAF